MPATSKSQQRLMGMVRAYQKGELKTKDIDKDLLGRIKKMSKQMKPETVKDFAKTKHDKLPQKVERRFTNFKYFPLLEYVDSGEEMNMRTFLDTINDETDVDILNYLLELIYSKKKYQDELDSHFSDDKNMLKFPVELAKEKDEETVSYIDRLITKRIKDIQNAPSTKNKPKKKKKEKREYPTHRKMGFGSSGEEQDEIAKQDAKTAYKKTGLGYKFRHMESFSLFEAKKKDPKKDLAKHRSKMNREERLKSGAKLGTKVVPDKKKQYKRKKNVDLENED